MSDVKKLIKQRIAEKPERAKIYREEEYRTAAALAIIELRKQKGLTQKELAQKVGKPQSTISRIETGEVNPSSSTLQALADATDTKLKLEFV